MNMKLRNVPFSPPDMTEAEITEVANALRSGWITTGPRTKEFERLISMCCQTEKSVCLNSATACMELILRVLGVGPGDEVITSAYTYTASASVICHVGAKVVLVDTAPGTFEMDYDKLSQAITEKTKVIIPVDLGGVICDYDKIFAANPKGFRSHSRNGRCRPCLRSTVAWPDVRRDCRFYLLFISRCEEPYDR